MPVTVDLSYLGIALTSLVFAGIGSYLGSYLKKKGENLATHEDLERIIEQVSIVTQTTRSIEARISNDVWSSQKRWEMKREVLFEAARRIAEIDDSLTDIVSISRVATEHPNLEWKDEGSRANERWVKAAKAIDETILLIEVVCGAEIEAAFDGFRKLANQIIVKTVGAEKEPDAYERRRTQYRDKLAAARAAIRKELEIDEKPGF